MRRRAASAAAVPASLIATIILCLALPVLFGGSPFVSAGSLGASGAPSEYADTSAEEAASSPSGYPSDEENGSALPYGSGEGEVSFRGIGFAEAEDGYSPAGGYSVSAPEKDDADRFMKKAEALLFSMPDGFTERVSEALGGLSVLLCGSISGGSGSPDPSPAALSIHGEGHMTAVIDVSAPDAETAFVHELVHAAEAAMKKLSAGDSFVSRGSWDKLNPDGFSYYEAYLAPDGTPYSLCGDPSLTAETETDPERIFFVGRYSKTYPSEDRASLVEALFAYGPRTAYLKSPRLTAKLSYCFAAARRIFDPERKWASRTVWEERLFRLSGNEKKRALPKERPICTGSVYGPEITQYPEPSWRRRPS